MRDLGVSKHSPQAFNALSLDLATIQHQLLEEITSVRGSTSVDMLLADLKYLLEFHGPETDF